jgi:hypothetical protein
MRCLSKRLRYYGLARFAYFLGRLMSAYSLANNAISASAALQQSDAVEILLRSPRNR